LGSYRVRAEPQTGQPYFAASAQVPDRPGPDPLTIDFDLVRGMTLSGRVTDRATQKPPRAAVVEYYSLFRNPHSARLTNEFDMAASYALVGPDGSYRLAVLPGPGVVCVAASPRNSYTVALLDEKELAGLVNDGINHARGHNPRTAAGARGEGIVCVNRYNALALLNPDEGAESVAVDLPLQPARPLRGTVVGPDGEPLPGVKVVGLTALPEDEVLDSASFTVTGLNPRRPRSLFFHHKGKGLAKCLTIGGDETGPLTVRLDPCGWVTGRLVDRGGKPVPEVGIFLRSTNHGIDNICTPTDRGGRFHIALVPGQPYSFGLSSVRRLLRSPGDVEVESGRSKDLGDLPVSD
jgi:hypothetical protein